MGESEGQPDADLESDGDVAPKAGRARAAAGLATQLTDNALQTRLLGTHHATVVDSNAPPGCMAAHRLSATPRQDSRLRMPILTPTTAYEIARAFPGATTLLKDDGVDHLQYAYRIQFSGVLTREIAITRMPTREGVTVYINKQACGGDKLELLEVRKRFQGARGLDEYPRGYVGKTGDKGISAGAGSCPSLLPANNDVLRVSCSDTDGFAKLVSWYSDVVIRATD